MPEPLAFSHFNPLLRFKTQSWWTFRNFFFLLGEGEGGVRGAEKGEDDFLLKIPGEGGGSPGGGGAEGPGGCLRRIGEFGGGGG